MALDTYANLQTSVANWLKRDDLTSAIPDFITLAETMMTRDFMNMEPPLKDLELNQSGTLTATGSSPFSVALPTGYKGTKVFQIQASTGDYYSLQYKTPTQLANYSITDRPLYYTTKGNNLYIAASPNTSYAYSWDYYAPVAALSGGNATNTILTNYPDLYLFGSLVHAEPFMKNDVRIQTWAGLYKNGLTNLEMMNAKERRSGSTLQIRSDVAL